LYAIKGIIQREKILPIADSTLSIALSALVQPGVLIGHRLIAPGDEHALLAAELSAFSGSVLKVRRQSGAARGLARVLLKKAGQGETAIPKSPSGAPVWPPGIVGSLAHDDEFAIAVIAHSKQFVSLGIDVEPAEALPSELVNLVATPEEQQRYSSTLLESRLLFSIKEAVYKAANPIDGRFLDFHEIEVDLDTCVAWIERSRSMKIAFTTYPRIVALAFW
jgi:4'-phosphopantetheinyl transferase EntD